MTEIACSKCKETIKKGAKKCKHCGADLRNWFVRHKFLTAVLVIILLIIFGSIAGGGSQEPPEVGGREEPQEEQPTAVEEEKKWESVLEVTTASDKQTDTFNLQGGKQKLVYETTGSGMTLCVVHVMKEGTSLEREGGFAEVTIDGTQSDETLLRKSEGDYYLDITIANGTCSIEVQELR